MIKNCLMCGKVIFRAKRGQRNTARRWAKCVTCSPKCSKNYSRLPTNKRKALKKCVDCGKELSHKNYKRCQKCGNLETSRQKVLKEIQGE